MSRVLVAGDSMVKYAAQYFPSRQGLSVKVSAHPGTRIELLLSKIADEVAGFDVVIVHVGTNNVGDGSVSVYRDKYRQLAQGIVERNPTAHVAFSAILPRGQNKYSRKEAQFVDLRRGNDLYRRANADLQELCRERGFTFLDGLESVWPSCLALDGVHPSRHGNKVLANFLYTEARRLVAAMERSHIRRCYQESHAASLWRGWVTEPPVTFTLRETDFPLLGSHASPQPASGAPTTPAPVGEARTAPLQRRDTSQLPAAPRGAGPALVGGVHVRCKGSKTWCTWDTLPFSVPHGLSVPAKGKADYRRCAQVPCAQPEAISRGASTIQAAGVTGGASQVRASRPVVRSSVEGEPRDVRRGGDGEWTLVLSKKRRRKAAALRKPEQSCVPAVSRVSGVLASAAANPLKWDPSLPVSASRSQKHLKRDFCAPASSAGFGGPLQGGANTSHGTAHDSFGTDQHVASRQQGSCPVAAAASVAQGTAVLSDAMSEVTGCKSRVLGQDNSHVTGRSGTAAGNPVKAGHIAAKSHRRLVALMPSCGVTTADVQTDCAKAATKQDPCSQTASFDAQAATVLVGGGGGGVGKIFVGAKFDTFVSFKECFDAWCAEGEHVVSISDSRKNVTPPDLREKYMYIRVEYHCIHNARVRSRGTGKRPNQKYNGLGCDMHVVVALTPSPALHYVVIKLNEEHRKHNLDTYSVYPKNRLLSSEEQAQVVNLQKLGVPSRKIREHVKNTTGKTVQTKDLNNIAQRHSVPIRNDNAHGEMFVKKMESLVAEDPNITIHYEKNDNDELQFVLIQTAPMKNVLNNYPGILFVDGTYKVNVENYVLYSILVEDSSGHGRSACYAFLKNETSVIVHAMFSKFVALNPIVLSACKVIMIDKDLNELQILSALLPNARILLCTWHVLRCLERQAHEKSRMQSKQLRPIIVDLIYSRSTEEYLENLDKLKTTASKEFCSYYHQNWHLCTELWVHAYRLNLPTLGNNTNNRIESHNHKIKAYLQSRLHLIDAIEALLKYIDSDSDSQQFAKLREMKLSLNVGTIDSFEVAVGLHCTSEARTKLREQYEKFNASEYIVSPRGSSYQVAFASKEYTVGQNLTTCTCSFHNQFGLPCVHIFAARSFAKEVLFDVACIPSRWRKDFYLNTSCPPTAITKRPVTSSIQPPPSVKLNTPEEKYCYAFKALCEMSKSLANVMANCSPNEIMEKLSSCDAFFRNLTAFTRNQTSINLQGAPAQLQVQQMSAAPGGSTSAGVSSLKIPLVKARRGRPKHVKTVKQKVVPLQKKRVSLAMIKADMLGLYNRYSLCDKDLQAVEEGTSLSDSVINVAQILIRKKFPGLSGFQDVLYGQGLKFSQVTGTFVQILHTESPDHWVTVTNAGAPMGIVFLYDSLDQDIQPDAVRQICNMLKPQSAALTIETKPAQNQGSTLDCGLFAIANMYYIASGKEPSSLTLSQKALRSHLLKCIRNGVMEDFPLTQSFVVRVRPKGHSYKLHCVCRQPLLNADKDLECTVCLKMFHRECLGLPAAKLNEKILVCSNSCKEVAKDRLQRSGQAFSTAS